ncbi:hypothetical protein, partial [Cohaesibacter celericrescens]
IWASLTISGPTIAGGYECSFTTSCYEETGCLSKTLVVEVIDKLGKTADLVSPGNTFPMIKYEDEDDGIASGTVAYTSLLTMDSMYMLTIYPNQSSRLSVHAYLNDAYALQFRGTCAVK